MKRIIGKFTIVFLFSLFFLTGCITTTKQVTFTPNSPSEGFYSKTMRDIVDWSIKYGQSIGYVPLDYNYEKGYVKMEKRYGPGGFAPVTWTIIVSCAPPSGNSIVVNIYTPNRAPDVNNFQEDLMKLYK